MINLFITVRFLDIIDILLFAILLYQVFKLLRGTAAIGIFAGVFSLYLIWLFVKALNMHLLSSILGQFIGVGVIALIIVFQPELRKGLLLLGNRNLSKNPTGLLRYFAGPNAMHTNVNQDIIVSTAFEMAESRTGALFVLQKNDDLSDTLQFKDVLNADTSSSLLNAIFQKQSPLHDGAVIISGNKIVAARTILPLSEKNLSNSFGTRHRAAVGISEISDALVIVVSEEKGEVSFVKDGKIKSSITQRKLQQLLAAEFESAPKEGHGFWEKWILSKSPS